MFCRLPPSSVSARSPGFWSPGAIRCGRLSVAAPDNAFNTMEAVERKSEQTIQQLQSLHPNP